MFQTAPETPRRCSRSCASAMSNANNCMRHASMQQYYTPSHSMRCLDRPATGCTPRRGHSYHGGNFFSVFCLKTKKLIIIFYSCYELCCVSSFTRAHSTSTSNVVYTYTLTQQVSFQRNTTPPPPPPPSQLFKLLYVFSTVCVYSGCRLCYTTI